MVAKESRFKGYDNVFSTRLRELMKKNRITQQQLSEKVDCSRQAISQYMDGSNAPNIDKLYNIARYFNVSADYLMGLSDFASTDTDITAICEYTGLSENAVYRICNEWETDEGIPIIAIYADEPEEIKRIENEIVCKNLLFEISHKIYDIGCQYCQAISNITPHRENFESLYNQHQEIQEYKRNIDGILFSLSTYVVDIARTTYSSEAQKFKEIENTIIKYIDEINEQHIATYHTSKDGAENGND